MIKNQQNKLNKKITQDNIVYSINENEKTAWVVDNESAYGDILIPHSIKHESNEYIITKICENSFAKSKSIKSIQFPVNSEIKTIEKNAFENSSLKSISIPSTLIELNDGWCSGTSKLTKINISQNNQRYLLYDDKIIIGKKSIENDEMHEILVFCVRDIKMIQIPNFIKIIGPYSFEYCTELQNVEFSSNSELRIIEYRSFSSCIIEKIKFPVHLEKIGGESFNCCEKLSEIEFDKNSEIKIIDKYSFASTLISSFTIPSSLVELNEGWCFGMEELNEIKIEEGNSFFKLYENIMIFGKSSIESDEFDVLVFCVRNAEQVNIPNYIRIIGPSAFTHCSKLRNVEIPSDSKLEKIGNNSFGESSIESIFIPSRVKIIDDYAFSMCNNLQSVEIQSNSMLEIIGEEAFNESAIKKISLPSSIKKIGTAAFSCCDYLTEIDIPIDSKIEVFEESTFAYSLIECITIPSNLIELKDGWNDYIPKLKKIIFSPNNPLFTLYENQLLLKKSSIESENFDILVISVKNIKSVVIPNFIKKIGSYAFDHCKNLRTIEISNDSQLQTIGKSAFNKTSINYINIPPHLTLIDECALHVCKNLRKINIHENSELQTIGEGAFGSLIESLYIPTTLIDLREGWCSCLDNLIRIKISPKNPRYLYFEEKYIIGKSSLDEEGYDCLLFARRNLKKAIIPTFIKQISASAFNYCELEKIEFQENAELQKIGKFAFYGSSIESIKFPQHLSEIDVSAFNFCTNLRKIDFPKNSQLQKIGDFAFVGTLIKSVYLPSHLKLFNECCIFADLQIIEVDECLELNEINQLKFYKNGIIMIPAKLNDRLDY